MRYTIDCDQAYALRFAGRPAALCPDFPGRKPETRVISYNVFVDDADYFVNVVPYEGADSGILATAIEIAHTFVFLLTARAMGASAGRCPPRCSP